MCNPELKPHKSIGHAELKWVIFKFFGDFII